MAYAAPNWTVTTADTPPVPVATGVIQGAATSAAPRNSAATAPGVPDNYTLTSSAQSMLNRPATDVAGPFGRVPVIATVDGQPWATSIWRDKTGGWLLAVPARIRPGKDHGDRVGIAIAVDPARL
jgi:Domain of unknown function (DUF1905)